MLFSNKMTGYQPILTSSTAPAVHVRTGMYKAVYKEGVVAAFMRQLTHWKAQPSYSTATLLLTLRGLGLVLCTTRHYMQSCIAGGKFVHRFCSGTKVTNIEQPVL